MDTNKGQTHYLSVISSGTGGDDNLQIRIHAKLGAILGLHDGEIVGVSMSSSNDTIIKRANVSCVSSDDWEILVNRSFFMIFVFNL